MKSYTTLINDYTLLTSNTTTQNVTLGTQLLNDSIRTIANMRGGRWPWLELVVNVATVANQEHVIIPANIEKIADLYVTVGADPTTNVVYMPYAVFDSHRWKLIIASRLGINDNPYFYYVFGNRILIQPIPATDGNIVTFRGRRKLKDINIADYTTGLISDVTSGDTTVIGATNDFQIDVPAFENFSVDVPVVDDFIGDSSNISAVPFTTDLVAATNILTVVSGTLASYGIVNASPIIYTSPTHAGFTNGNTYYVGNISGDTFKAYTDVGLTMLVDITVDTAGADFTIDGGPAVTMDTPATTAAQGIVNGTEVIYTGTTGNGLTANQHYWAGLVTATTFTLYTDDTITTKVSISGVTNDATFQTVLSPVATLTSGTTTDLEMVNADPIVYTGATGGGLTNGTTYYAGNVTTTTFKIYNDGGLSALTDITGNLTAVDFKIGMVAIATLVSGTTSAFGIVNGSAVQYTGSTANGLVHNTVYYTGHVTSTTFKLYTDAALTTLVVFTGNVSAGDFQTVTTAWTTSMAGRWLRINSSNTDNNGDEQWYEIASVTSATELELVAPYQGTSIIAGSATYTIGQMSVIPEPYDTSPLYRAVALYWQSKDNDKYKQYMLQYDGGYEAGLQQTGPGGLVGQLIETTGETTEGAYIPVSDPSWVDPNVPPRYPLTGFAP